MDTAIQLNLQPCAERLATWRRQNRVLTGCEQLYDKPPITPNPTDIARRSAWDVRQGDGDDFAAAAQETEHELTEPFEARIFELRHRLATSERLGWHKLLDAADWRRDLLKLETESRRLSSALFSAHLAAIEHAPTLFSIPSHPAQLVLAANCQPPQAPSRLAVKQARCRVKAAVAQFFAAIPGYDPDSQHVPPVHALRCDVALGKSSVARDSAVVLLTELCVQADGRTGAVLVPTLELAAAAATAFNELPAAITAGLTAAVWRGRDAPNPNLPGQTMCADLARVQDALAAGQDVQSSCCKRRKARCPFAACGYQSQLQQRPNLWFGAHQLLYMAKPAAFGQLAFLIVDESPVQAALLGVEGRPTLLSSDSLSTDDAVPSDKLATARLRSLRSIALDVLREAPDGWALRQAWMDAGMTPEGAAEARTLEWRRKIDAKMHPSMSRGEYVEAARAAKGNATIRRLAMFWTAIEALLADKGPEKSGWAALVWSNTPEGRVRALQLKSRRNVAAGWRVPTLLLDATMNVDLVRPIWPNVELTADVTAETPHQHIYQAIDRPFSKRHYDMQRNDLNKTEVRRRTGHLRKLNASLATIGRRFAPSRTLVVVQKTVRESLSSVGMLPPTIDVRHHNAVAGLDDWKNAAALVVVGRTAPSPADVERAAEALTGRAVEALSGWYPKATTHREMVSGELVPAECDRHPDPIAEAFRWRACVGELVQIIGRGRGVNRAAADPLRVFVLTDVPLPLPLAGIVSAADFAPTPAELMLGCGGIAFSNAAHAAAAYPELWNPSAARAAFERAADDPRSATFSYEDSLPGECRTPPAKSLATYQLAGAGQKLATIEVDPALVLDARTELERVLGKKLAVFRQMQPGETPQQATSPPGKHLTSPLLVTDSNSDTERLPAGITVIPKLRPQSLLLSGAMQPDLQAVGLRAGFSLQRGHPPLLQSQEPPP